MKKIITAVLISLTVISQSFALASTHKQENFAEIMSNCSNMIECHKLLTINTGNLAPTGEILVMNIYAEAESLGGK